MPGLLNLFSQTSSPGEANKRSKHVKNKARMLLEQFTEYEKSFLRRVQEGERFVPATLKGKRTKEVPEDVKQVRKPLSTSLLHSLCL